MARLPGGPPLRPVLSAMRRSAPLLAGAILLHAAPLAAQAGFASAARSVTLMATRLPTVSVTVPVGGAAGLRGIPVATSWNADPAEPVAVSLVAFFDAPSGTRPTGSAAPQAGAGRMLFTQRVSAQNARGVRSDDIQVRIDLADRPDLTPGTYTGTLNLQAITQ